MHEVKTWLDYELWAQILKVEHGANAEINDCVGIFLLWIYIYDLDCMAQEIDFAYLVLAKFVLLILVDNEV